MRIIALVVPTFVVGLLVACSQGSSSSDLSPTPTAPGQGGITPPLYEQPLLMKDGDYWPTDVPFETVAKAGQIAASEDADKPPFDGTIAGIRLYSFSTAAMDPNVEKARCVVDRFEVSNRLDITYLPAGTWAKGPQFAGVCKDDSESFVMQQFATKHGSFEVILEFGEPAFGHDASASRVHEELIGDRAGVVIAPVTDDGFGRGWAAYVAETGLFRVDARNLPVHELVEIVGGVK